MNPTQDIATGLTDIYLNIDKSQTTVKDLKSLCKKYNIAKFSTLTKKNLKNLIKTETSNTEGYKKYSVKSMTKPGTQEYIITHNTEENKWKCSCDHHYYRIKKEVPLFQACKHCKSVGKQDKKIVKYRVKSYSNKRRMYGITHDTANNLWTCSCPDHFYRIKNEVPLDMACKHCKKIGTE